MKYLAIDYGTKTTGLAVCDPTETIVSPLTALPTSEILLEKIARIVKKEAVEAIVMGLPLNMDGSAGTQAQIVQRLADKLKKMVTVPVYFQDERLSSFAAEEKLVLRDLTRKKRKARIDALAAAEILQSFLDSKRN